MSEGELGLTSGKVDSVPKAHEIRSVKGSRKDCICLLLTYQKAQAAADPRPRLSKGGEPARKGKGRQLPVNPLSAKRDPRTRKLVLTTWRCQRSVPFGCERTSKGWQGRGKGELSCWSSSACRGRTSSSPLHQTSCGRTPFRR